MTDPMDAATYAAKLRELIAWAEERKTNSAEFNAVTDGGKWFCLGRADAFHEVANHLRKELEGKP